LTAYSPSPRRSPVPLALVTVLCLPLFLPLALPTAARAATLSTAEVACEAARLDALARRTRAVDPRSLPVPGQGPEVPATVLYAPARGADLNGTAFTNQWRREGAAQPAITESHLAFTVTVLRQTLLNPARPPLFQVGMMREASSSSAVDPGDPRALAVEVNPTLDDAPPAAAFLAIDNLETGNATAVTSDSKPGRGLQVDGITTACSDRYDEGDLDFLDNLAQRLIRPRAWNDNPAAPRAYDVVGGLFRDTEPGVYRLALRAVDPADGTLRGRLALRIEAPRTAEGGLAAGHVEIVSGCDPLGCTEGPARWEIFFVPPAFPTAPAAADRTWSAAAAGAARLSWTPAGGDPASAPVSWNLLLRDTAWNRVGFVKGVALSPRGFPDDFSHLPEFFAEAAGLRDAGVLWNGSWLSGVRETGWDGSGPMPLPGAAELLADRAGALGFTPLYVLGWRSGATPDLATPGDPATDWSDAEARHRYAQLAGRLAGSLHPPFLFLGNESDAYFETAPADYARWISAYEEAYAAVKVASPETRVGPVFQYENLAGLDGLSGDDTTPQWGALEAHDPATVDVVGITLYPFLGTERAERVPDEYLEPLAEHLSQLAAPGLAPPIVVTETGWPAEAAPDQPVPWQVSPSSQVAYVDRLFGLLRGHDVRAVVWLFLYPPVDDGSLDARLFGSISLRDEAGNPRPVYDAWAKK